MALSRRGFFKVLASVVPISIASKVGISSPSLPFFIKSDHHIALGGHYHTFEPGWDTPPVGSLGLDASLSGYEYVRGQLAEDISVARQRKFELLGDRY